MLTGDNAEEMMRDNDGEEPDERGISYDHPAIVQGLAHASIKIVLQALAHTPAVSIITAITYVSRGSPKFYNYTTDYYIAGYTVDSDALTAYIDANREAIVAIASKYNRTICDDGVISLESMQHAAVCHIINEAIHADDYNMAMWEIENDVYYQNMEWTTE